MESKYTWDIAGGGIAPKYRMISVVGPMANAPNCDIVVRGAVSCQKSE
jgi:hypothetical protein